MSQDQLLINGDLLRLRREARGWALNDMATRACMSTKQIRQLEEGGMSSFYSEAVKVTAAKKVGALLGLSADEVFVQEAIASVDLAVQAAEVSIAEPEVAHPVDSVSEPSIVEATIDVASESSVPSSAPSVSVVRRYKTKKLHSGSLLVCSLQLWLLRPICSLKMSPLSSLPPRFKRCQLTRQMLPVLQAPVMLLLQLPMWWLHLLCLRVRLAWHCRLLAQ